MSAREKVRTLYSRNGIRIIKTENIHDPRKRWGIEKFSRNEKLENAEIRKERGEYIKIKHESPLGFYYTTHEWKNDNSYNKKPKNVTYRKYIIWLENTKYELEYPIEYCANDNVQHINVDMRPWDILPGYKGMPDNMINTLIKEANRFIDLIFEYKNTFELSLTPEQYRKSIMIDLFGYEDGPKIQPNNIKILSHGFDLKESFRKRKES